MKKFICFALLTAMCVSLFASCGVVLKNPLNDVFVLDGSSRYSRYGDLDITAEKTLTVVMAKNDSEGGQFALRSDEYGFANASVSASAFTTADELYSLTDIELFREAYIPSDFSVTPLVYDGAANILISASDYPEKVKTSVAAGENLIYYIKVKTDSETVAGDYFGTVTVTFDGGSRTLPVKVTVIDFALSETPLVRSDTLFWTSFVPRYYESFAGITLDDDMILELRRQSNRILLENKLTTRSGNPDTPKCYGTNYTYYAQTMHAYLDANPAITCYEIPVPWINYTDEDSQGRIFVLDEEKSLLLFEALRQEGILDKGILCCADEPHTDQEYEAVNRIGAWLNANAPDVKLYITILPEQKSEINTDAIDCWCGIIGYVDVDTVLKYEAKGDEVWGYAFDKLTSMDLNEIRNIGWELKKYGMVGYEDWCTNLYSTEYDDINHIWKIDTQETALTSSYLYPGYVGDGVIDENVFLPTLTLEALRDGIEDYELLKAVEEDVSAKITEWGLDMNLYTAMLSYYEGQMLDVHRLQKDVNLEFTRLRKRLINDVLNGVDYIVTADRDEINWRSDNRTFTVYTAADAEFSGSGFAVEHNNNYNKYTLYTSVPAEGLSLDFSVNGVKKHIFYVNDVLKNEALTDFNAEGVTEALAKANPGTEFGFEKIDGITYLRIELNAANSYRFKLPNSLFVGHSKGYTDVRCNMFASAGGTVMPKITMTSKRNSDILVGNKALSTKPTVTTFAMDTSHADGADFQNLQRINVSVSENVPVTLYISDLYYVNTSNEFSWEVVDE